MPSKQHAYKMRAHIEKAAASLTDTEALETPELFPLWEADHDYTKGNRVRYGDRLYRLIPETHHSQADWPPDLTPAVWARVDDPAEEWPEWVQPLGAEDAYDPGAKVSHNGKHWINSLEIKNTWEPGVFGWTEQEEAEPEEPAENPIPGA